MTGLRYSPLHVTEFCGEMQGKFKVRLINKPPRCRRKLNMQKSNVEVALRF